MMLATIKNMYNSMELTNRSTIPLKGNNLMDNLYQNSDKRIQEGKKIAIIGRGYRRSTKGFLLVSDGKTLYENAKTAGDELFMHASALPSAIIIADDSSRRSVHHHGRAKTNHHHSTGGFVATVRRCHFLLRHGSARAVPRWIVRGHGRIRWRHVGDRNW